MRYPLIFTFLFGVVFPVSGQNILQQKTSWHAANILDNSNSGNIEIESDFVIDRQNTIQWTQNAGIKTYNFSIVSTEGQWPDTSTNGGLRYNVQLNDLHGVIFVGREDNELVIRMEFMQDGVNTMPFTFPIDLMEIIL